jgi:hypothetical protein
MAGRKQTTQLKAVKLAAQARELLPTGPPPELLAWAFKPKPLPRPKPVIHKGQLDLDGNAHE